MKNFSDESNRSGLYKIFTSVEMLLAENQEHIHQLVRDMLAGKIDKAAWAEMGYKAVIDRHTYVHRAMQIRRTLIQ